MANLGSFLGGLGGSTIGAASVQLFVDSSKYNSEMAAAEAKAKGSTSTMGKSLGAFKQVAGLAFAAVGLAAIKFGVDSVAAAREAQAAQTELANSIENSSAVSEAAIPAFNAQADAIRGLTGADDEAITSAQAFLVQMGLTESQITDLIPLIVDLATKFDIDMETAAKAVGKSVNGTTGGLAKMGVVVNKTAAETDAYAATLSALTVVQGFAAQKAEDEPWRLLASQFEEIQEIVGAFLIPTLNAMAKALLLILQALPKLTIAVVAFGAAWAAVNFSQVITALSNIMLLLRALPALLTAATSATLALLAATLGLAAALAAGEAMSRKTLELDDALEGLRQTGASTDGIIRVLTEEYNANSAVVRVAVRENITYSEALKQVARDAQGTKSPFMAMGAGVRAVGRSIKGVTQNMKEELQTWADEIKASFDISGESIEGFKRDFTGTVRSFTRGLANMRARAEEMVKDLQEFNKLDIGKQVREFFLNQGPDAIHQFVAANKEGQRTLVQDAKGYLDAQEDVGRAVDDSTAKVISFKKKFAGLNMKAKAEVEIHYSVSGVDIGGLPGLAP